MSANNWSIGVTSKKHQCRTVIFKEILWSPLGKALLKSKVEDIIISALSQNILKVFARVALSISFVITEHMFLSIQQFVAFKMVGYPWSHLPFKYFDDMRVERDRQVIHCKCHIEDVILSIWLVETQVTENHFMIWKKGFTIEMLCIMLVWLWNTRPKKFLISYWCIEGLV